MRGSSSYGLRCWKKVRFGFCSCNFEVWLHLQADHMLQTSTVLCYSTALQYSSQQYCSLVTSYHMLALVYYQWQCRLVSQFTEGTVWFHCLIIRQWNQMSDLQNTTLIYLLSQTQAYIFFALYLACITLDQLSSCLMECIKKP